jgi:protoheme IX farnesyltransferase
MWLLFGIVFLWQIPHVMAIAWVCKDDYQHAGFHMLPANDQKGYKATASILGCLILLLPVTWGVFETGLDGWIYLAGALLTAFAFLWYGILFARNRTKEAAKKLMFFSFAYLPLVWLFVIVDQLFY